MKKIVSLILALLLLLTALSACSDDKPEESKAPSSAADVSKAETSDEEQSEETSEGFKYATKRFAGTTVKILTVDSSRHTYGEMQFVPDDELVSNTINEAVKERNNYIYDNFGITIETRTESYPSDVLLNEIEGDAADYDLVCESVDRMVTRLADGLFLSLDEYIDVNDDWWDERALDNLSLDGVKHFFVSGDCMLTDVDNVYLTLFNKKIYADNVDVSGKYGDIYELVRSRQFTLDVFTEMAKAVSVADANGKWSFDATFGNLSHSYGATIMVNGCGVAMVEKSADGLRSTVLDERSQRVFDKVYALMSDKQTTERAELIIGKGSHPSSYGFAELEEMFTSGRGLFYNTTVSSISILKNSSVERDFEFGVLPIPLYDENQENYFCAVNRYQSSVIGVPVSAYDNIDAAAFLLNALGYCNTNLPSNVMLAYKELTLKLQASDTEDDFEMLDLVFDSRFYDLGSIFTWGDLYGLYGSLINNAKSNTLVSTYEAMQDKVESAIAETYEEYLDSQL